MTRDELVLRLMALADVRPDADVLTLRWSPLKDHALWGAIADEMLYEIEKARLDGASRPGRMAGR